MLQCASAVAALAYAMALFIIPSIAEPKPVLTLLDRIRFLVAELVALGVSVAAAWKGWRMYKREENKKGELIVNVGKV